MPGFVRTPEDEAKWSKAKDAAGKSTKVGSESYWKLANYIFHKSDNDSQDLSKAISTKVPSVAIPNPAKVGSTAVKMPKSKKMADPFGKPSLFFKSEHENIKHPSLIKLRDFMSKKHKV